MAHPSGLPLPVGCELLSNACPPLKLAPSCPWNHLRLRTIFNDPPILAPGRWCWAGGLSRKCSQGRMGREGDEGQASGKGSQARGTGVPSKGSFPRSPGSAGALSSLSVWRKFGSCQGKLDGRGRGPSICKRTSPRVRRWRINLCPRPSLPHTGPLASHMNPIWGGER